MSRQRTVIENVRPSVDGGRYSASRVAGDTVPIRADIYTDGHDLIRAVVKYRKIGEPSFAQAELEPQGNDSWIGHFTVSAIGTYEFVVEAWIDHFDAWIDGLRKKAEVDAESDVDLQVGAQLLKGAAARCTNNKVGDTIMAAALLFESTKTPIRERAGRALEEELIDLVRSYPDRSIATTTEQTFTITVDPPRAVQHLVRDVSSRGLQR